MSVRLTEDARRMGSIGGKARAAKLSPTRRREIARQAAKSRWGAGRQDARDHLPRVRIPAADYFALPTENPLSGACWRKVDDRGRLLLIQPDTEIAWLGLKIVPVLVVPVAAMRAACKSLL